MTTHLFLPERLRSVPLGEAHPELQKQFKEVAAKCNSSNPLKRDFYTAWCRAQEDKLDGLQLGPPFGPFLVTYKPSDDESAADSAFAQGGFWLVYDDCGSRSWLRNQPIYRGLCTAGGYGFRGLVTGDVDEDGFADEVVRAFFQTEQIRICQDDATRLRVKTCWAFNSQDPQRTDELVHRDGFRIVGERQVRHWGQTTVLIRTFTPEPQPHRPGGEWGSSIV